MTEVERTLATAGEEARRLVDASIDLDADLAATLQRAEAAPTVLAPRDSKRPRGTHLVIVMAASLVLLLVGVLVMIDRGDDRSRTVGTIAPVPDPTLAPGTTPERVPTTDGPSVSDPVDLPAPTVDITSPRVSVALPPQPVVLPVSHIDPPPTYEPMPFATIEITGAIDETEFAVGDGVLVAVESGDQVTEYDIATATTTKRVLAEQIGLPVMGPGNVLYGVSFTPPADPSRSQMPTAALVAQPLAADPIVVSGSVPASVNDYGEARSGTLVAGPDGIYDVARRRAAVMDYIDGPDPAWADASVAVVLDPDQVVRTLDGSAQWTIPVVADPSAASPYDGDPLPAAGPDGSIRISRFIGPRLETEPVDFGTPTNEVVADLVPGAGQWWSLPDGWRTVASSVHGTLLARGSGNSIDVAWFEPPPPRSLPFQPSTVLVSTDDGFVTIDRDETGAATQQIADERIGWPNGCTIDMITVLFDEAATGSVLERVACNQTEPRLARGVFSSDGRQASIVAIETDVGWSTDVPDVAFARFSNFDPPPLLAFGSVPIGETTPVTIPLTDSVTTGSPALYEIADAASTPSAFGDDIGRLLQTSDPSTQATTAVFDLAHGTLVVVTEQRNTGPVDQTLHSYWFSDRPGVERPVLSQAIDSDVCTVAADGTTCR